MVRYISQLAAQNVNRSGERIAEKQVSAMQRLIQKFRKWLEEIWSETKGLFAQTLKPRSFKKRQPVETLDGKSEKYKMVDVEMNFEEMTLQDVADFTSLTDIAFDLKSKMDVLETLDMLQAVATKPRKNRQGKVIPPVDNDAIIKRLRTKINVLSDTAKTRLKSDQLEDEVRTLRSILSNPDTVESLTEFVEQGLRGLNWANEEFSRLTARLKDEEGEPLTQAEVTELSRRLSIVKTLLAFYQEDVQRMLYRITDPNEIDDKTYRKYSEIIRRSEVVAKDIKNRSVDLMVEWLYPSVQNANELIKEKYPDYVLTKEQFKNQMYAANSDVDKMFFWLGSVGSSRDSVSAIVSDVLKHTMENQEEHNAEISEVLKGLYDNFLKEKSIANDRKITGEYYKKHYLRKAKVLEKVGEKINEEGKPEPVMDYVERWAFHEQYFVDKWAEANAKFVNALPTPNNKAEYEVYSKTVADWTLIHGSYEKPSELYRNPDFDKLYGKDKMFSAMYDYYKQANDKLVDERLKFGMIPQVSTGKGMFSDLKWSKNGLGMLVQRAINTVKADPNDFAVELENLDGSTYRSIKVAYIRPLEETDLDFALPETVFKFASTANIANAMTEIEPNVVILKSLIDENSSGKFISDVRKVNRVSNDKKTMFDRVFKRPAKNLAPRVNKQLTAFIDDVVYGQTEVAATVGLGYRQILENTDEVRNNKKLSASLATAKQMEADGKKPYEILNDTKWQKDDNGNWYTSGKGFTFDMNKVGNNLAFLTALNNMALNVTAGISNTTIGNIQSLGEALGGKYYKPANWIKAQRQYWGSTGEFIADTNRLKKGKVTLLGIKYDAIQGEFRDKFGKRFVGSVAQKYATSDTLFILSHAAEHQIQLTGMLALMDATRVPLKDGGNVSLFEAHVDNGRGGLKLRDDAIWTDQDNSNFSTRLHAINKILNGNYSKFDKAHLQRLWYGKLALIYRKFLYNGFRARYGKKRMDYELKDVYEGYYRTFLKKLVSDVKAYKMEGIARAFTKKGWSADEAYAWNKTMFELAVFAGAWMLGIALGSVDEDEPEEDKTWIRNYMTLMMLRLRSEVGTYSFFGIQDIARIVEHPSAVVGTLSKFGVFFGQLITGPLDEYERKTGVFAKGDSVLWAKFQKMIPLWRQYLNLQAPEEQAKFYTFINKNF
jgi:hypothetical protein